VNYHEFISNQWKTCYVCSLRITLRLSWIPDVRFFFVKSSMRFSWRFTFHYESPWVHYKSMGILLYAFVNHNAILVEFWCSIFVNISMRFSWWFTFHCESPRVHCKSLWKSCCMSIVSHNAILVEFWWSIFLGQNQYEILIMFHCESPWVHCKSLWKSCYIFIANQNKILVHPESLRNPDVRLFGFNQYEILITFHCEWPWVHCESLWECSRS